MTPWHQRLLARGASIEGSTVTGFGDTENELVAARDAAVVCDLQPLASLRVAGPDAETFLQGQVTSDVTELGFGASQYSAWCTPKGRVLANFLLRRVDAETFELLLPEPLLASIRKRLGMFVLRSKVALDDASERTVRIGVGGPAAAQLVEVTAGAVPPVLHAVTLDGGVLVRVLGDRFVAIVSPEGADQLWDRLAAGARPVGFPSWQWLTLRAGVPVILPATQDQFIPQALNWDAIGGVSFQKGCYTGQEIVARTQYLGRRKERTVLAHAESTVLRLGARLFSASFGEQPCGTVLNAASAPDGGTDFLAVAQNAAVDGADLRLAATGGEKVSLLTLPYKLRASAAPRGPLM
jgi:folate-binding protein YgfZ